jgi:hypothetical protein
MMVYALWTALSTNEGARVATVRLSARRLLVAGACSIALAAAPAAVMLAGQSSPTGTLADQCSGGINWNVMSEGAPIASNCGAVGGGPVTPGVPSAGPPSEQTITNCSGIPGCLSNSLYGPGNVVVPNPNTTVQQSQ